MSRLLTTREAETGIYLDFEGRTDHAPVLLGYLAPDPGDGGVASQAVLDDHFAPAAAAHGQEVVDIEPVIERLVLRAESEDRRLIGWSTHEIDIVERHCASDLARRFRERYTDAKMSAKAARRQLGLRLPPTRGREKGHTLARYMQLVGHEVPWVFGAGWTGTTIRVLDPALARHGDWRRLTPRQKMRWSFVLGHDRLDCEGTRAVALWATACLTHGAFDAAA
jgi:hypothetical protein